MTLFASSLSHAVCNPAAPTYHTLMEQYSSQQEQMGSIWLILMQTVTTRVILAFKHFIHSVYSTSADDNKNQTLCN